MGVVAPYPPRVRQARRQSQIPLFGAAALYCCAVAVSIYFHEPWADEAQAWLLARDSSLVNLWAHLLHYEGTPGVWHTLLHVLIRFGLPYEGLNAVSGALGVASAWMILRYAPLPLAVRILLPFTFFLGYQYPVVARSYSAVPLLALGCALIYKSAIQRIALFTLLLSLMAGLGLHALMLSVSIWMAFYLGVARRWHAVEEPDRRRLVISGSIYIAVVMLMIASAWPARDVAFPYHLDFSIGHFLSQGLAAFSEAFAGQPLLSLAAVALSIPFLRRGGTLGMFLLASVLLCAASAIVYANVWHHGILFLAWLIAIWIAAGKVKPAWPVLASLGIVIGLQCYWTVDSWRYDRQQQYSGGRDAAIFLGNSGIAGQPTLCAGFPCVAVQPYFNRNIFSNFDHAYWDWSKQSRTDDPAALFRTEAPPFLLVGYKTEPERLRWTSLANMAGYREIRHFEGNVFWRTRILQPESFDLYRRGTPPVMASAIDMANPNAGRQLLSGFYAVENNSWRWTARDFSVALQTPPDTARPQLVLRFFISGAQSKNLGPMTLHAEVNGKWLDPQTYNNSGTFTYTREIPADALRQQVIPVNFSLDKAAPPAGAEARELGVIVTSIELTRP